MNILHYIPILTTVVSFIFTGVIFQRFFKRGKRPHLFWWGFGVFVYGLGTLAESYFSLFGWNEAVFKFWYIVGALMGGAPLAQGTVWYLLKKRTAAILTVALVLMTTAASIFVILSPVDPSAAQALTPSGSFFEWQWIRLFSPFINTYAAFFLIGGAVISAWRYRKLANSPEANSSVLRDRFIGNVFIAVGALLPGIGGASSRMGYTIVLYVTELLGITCIWLGYWFNIRKLRTEPKSSQVAAETSTS